MGCSPHQRFQESQRSLGPGAEWAESLCGAHSSEQESQSAFGLIPFVLARTPKPLATVRCDATLAGLLNHYHYDGERDDAERVAA